MFRPSVALLCSSLALCFCQSALAWNAAGHRLVAAIAWRHMPGEAREQVADLLRLHPFHSRWTNKASDDPAYQAFLESSTWPDDIRRDDRFYDEEQERPTPPLPALSDSARHKSWHYLDLADDGSRSGDLDRQIERLSRLLANPTSPWEERIYALPWLIHLLGDVHQPLHVGQHGDEGGNAIAIENPFNPRLPITNLHAWWDDLPGPPWLRGKRLEDAADRLLAAYPQAPRQGGVALWLDESRRIGRQQAYPPPGAGAVPVISADFRDQSRAIANRRLTEAGYRLGRLLSELFGSVPRGTR